MPFVSINPATEVLLEEIPSMSSKEVDRALTVAATAYAGWKVATFHERSDVMQQLALLLEDELNDAATLMTKEMGKTLVAAKSEVLKCVATLRYFAQHAESFLSSENLVTRGSRSGVRFEPTGAIFAVMPWNFPLWQVVRMAAPTLMAGNVVLFKHAPNVPGCAKYLEGLFQRAGFPPGVLTSLFVEIDQVPNIVADDRIVGVTLTGSERAGRSIGELAGRNLKKCVLELGSSDPFVIAPSADLDITVPMAVNARIQNNGQACIAAKRFIVVKERSDEFINRFVEAMAGVTMGDPMESTIQLGPLVSRSQRELLANQVEESLASGAVCLTGGVTPVQTGYYYPATVLTNVPRDSPAGCQELFGPVAVVMVADDLDAAISMANETPWGLGGSIWATDSREIEQGIRGMDVGTVFANAIVASMNELPFGGTKRSGFGRELSALGTREFTNVKSFFVA